MPNPSNSRKFRIAVLPLFLFVLVGSILGIACLFLIDHRRHFDLHALLRATVALLVLSLLWACLLHIFFPASFTADGIYGHSFWGPRRFVRWQDIKEARTFRSFNLNWLRIYATDNTVTWLALFQSHQTAFREEIQRLAPVGNPILNHLR
jgi:hypothetical protein